MWIFSKRYDLLYIIGPGLFASIFVVLLFLFGFAPTKVSPIQWLILVVFIDVAHVWSTLFRTYLSRKGQVDYKNHLWLTPIACYFLGVFIHSLSAGAFWRILAYLAVFHFIRQQYGFFQIYSKQETKEVFPLLSKITIYSATVIPIIIWHLNGQQNINWFMEGDFFYINQPNFTLVFYFIAVAILLAYLIKEVKIAKNSIFAPKTLLLFSTLITWWVGIVWIKTDWSFTLTNVIAHGIPYFALIYKSDIENSADLIWPRSIPIVFTFIFLFFVAYLEEGFWDIFVWKDHESLFPFSRKIFALQDVSWLALIVPLLALPQATHYVLDGFIWKKPVK